MNTPQQLWQEWRRFEDFVRRTYYPYPLTKEQEQEKTEILRNINNLEKKIIEEESLTKKLR